MEQKPRNYDEWKQWCETVQNQTTVLPNETPANKKARINRLLNNYNDFVLYYFPHYVTNKDTGKITPCAKFQINAANTVLKNKNLKRAFKWARGHAKSTHFDIFIPMWLKAMKQLRVMVLVGKSETSANTLLSDIQAELQFNQRYIADFGEQYNFGSWQDGEFFCCISSFPG